MNGFFLGCALFLVVLMAASLYRAVAGPTTLDRLAGMNAIGSKTVILILLMGFLFHRVNMFVDIAIAYGLLNFIGVLAASRYFHKRKGLEQETADETPGCERRL
jgi:multicomponent Na+:H+ antiporter subunit F